MSYDPDDRACPRRQCRGWTPHNRVRHFTPAWLAEAYWTIRLVLRRWRSNRR